MKNEIDRSVDINAWAARQQEVKLHEEVQCWGESVLPLLENETADDLPDRLALFEFLMTSVEHGDQDVAWLIHHHEAEMIASTRSWYTGKPESLSSELREQLIQQQFMAWLKIYKIGRF